MQKTSVPVSLRQIDATMRFHQRVADAYDRVGKREDARAARRAANLLREQIALRTGTAEE